MSDICAICGGYLYSSIVHHCRTAPVPQAAPIPNAGPAIQDLVAADIAERKRVGIERYGTPLQPFNGRDALRDAYEEALDLCQYLRQAIYERDGR